MAQGGSHSGWGGEGEKERGERALGAAGLPKAAGRVNLIDESATPEMDLTNGDLGSVTVHSCVHIIRNKHTGSEGLQDCSSAWLHASTTRQPASLPQRHCFKLPRQPEISGSTANRPPGWPSGFHGLVPEWHHGGHAMMHFGAFVES